MAHCMPAKPIAKAYCTLNGRELFSPHKIESAFPSSLVSNPINQNSKKNFKAKAPQGTVKFATGDG